MKKLILFDLDGTLLDTLEDLSAAVNYALELRGLPLLTVDEYRGMVGHGVRNLVAQALERSMNPMPDNPPVQTPPLSFRAKPNNPTEAEIDAALADFKSYYQAHIDVHTRPYPGIPELLADLHNKGILLAVASNKFQEGTEYLVHHFFPGIEFVAILGQRPGWPMKPAPEIVRDVLQKAAAAMGQKDFAPDDTLMVGDSPTDMRTAFNGGIEARAVCWGYRSAEELWTVLSELYPELASSTAAANHMLVHNVPALRIELLGFYVSEPLSNPPSTFDTPLQELIYKTFASCHILFERVVTDPGITMEDCSHISSRVGVDIVKTVFLCNRQQTEFYLYVTSHDKPFVTKEFCGALGIPRVSFASAEKLWELTGAHVGATTILSAAWPACSGVHLVMDASLARSGRFACTDGTPTCFVTINTADLINKFLSGRKISLI